MEFTRIPNIEQKVSRIGLGTWAIGGWMWGGSDDSESIKTIHQALDLGINLIDTAAVYGFGRSEEIVGKAIKQYGNRNKIIVATKAGISWKNEQEVYRDSRKETLLRELEASLKRLQVDYIDLYQIHWPDPLTDFAETAATLNQFQKEGKIRAIGVSNFSVQQIQSFQQAAPLHALQSPFNMFEKWIENTELAYCVKNNIALLGYGSLCRGLLTGKIGTERQFIGDDLRQSDPKFQEPRFSQYLKCVQLLDSWAQQKYHKPVLALAIRWALDKGINVALWGARHPHQLEGIELPFGWKLTPKDMEEIDRIMKETITNPVNPEAMGPPSR